MCTSSLLRISSEVSRALRHGAPLLALESTILTHGMLYPDNLQMAVNVEDVVRKRGAVPATIGVIDGVVHVGMDQDHIHRLASGSHVKISRRDFPFVLANKLTGGTTVSGTMHVAHKAGIKLFVTGGIGGVHRDFNDTFDISADITELARTPVAVISAGIKSILDIGKTLELLETMGVCVATFAKDGQFPCFFSEQSGFQAPYRVDSPLQAAQMIHANQLLGTRTGLLFGVPIPAQDAAQGALMEQHIREALELCQKRGISGKHITPFVLKHLNQATQGESLRANLALIQNNAQVGADIAVHFAKLTSDSPAVGGPALAPVVPVKSDRTPCQKRSSRPVVVGGSNLDIVCKATGPDPLRFCGVTNPGLIRPGFGGVARNVAEALARLGANPLFISAVGADEFGSLLLNHCSQLDKCAISVHKKKPTSSYCVMLDSNGDVAIGMGDIHQMVDVDHVEKFRSSIESAPIVFIDANPHLDTINHVLEICFHAGVPVFLEPTDQDKVRPVIQSPFAKAIAYASPNLAELRACAGVASGPSAQDCGLKDLLDECLALSVPLLDTMPFLLITLGSKGVLVVRKLADSCGLSRVSARHYPVQPAANVVSVLGAGDCLAATFIAALLKGCAQDEAVAAGIQAASLSLASRSTVPAHLDASSIAWFQAGSMAPVELDVSNS